MSEARRLLESMAGDRLVGMERRVDAVQILSPDDAAAQSFDALWVAGMTSDAWPPPARPNPLVPIELQRRAGIPAACIRCDLI